MRVLLVGMLLMAGCVTAQKQIYLGAGESVEITAPTEMTLKITPESLIIKAKDYKLGENLIVE